MFSMIVQICAWIAGYYGFFASFFFILRRASPQTQFKCFMICTISTMVVSFAWSLLAHPFFFLIGRHDLAQFTTSYVWWYLTAPVVGLNLHIEGEQKLHGWGGRYNDRGPCVFLANHQSELDVFLMGRLWQHHMVACATWRVRSMPLFGPYMRLCRTVFVDPPKTSKLSNLQLLQDAAEMMRTEGKNVLVFPEGVRSYATQADLLPFKRGALVLAMKAGNVPVVPIVVGNMSSVFDFKNGNYRPGTINVRILDPVSTKLRSGESDPEAMERVLGELKGSMLQTLKDIS